MPADFVHLRCHTNYSLLEGALRAGDLTRLCRQNAMPAVGIADTHNLFGALDVADELAKAGIQPLVGCQLQMAPSVRLNLRPSERPPALVLLVQDETGWRNLMQLVSDSYLAGDAGGAVPVSLAQLAARAGGLLCLTGGADGLVGSLLRHGHEGLARQVLDQLQEIFADRLYVEIQRHSNGPPAAMEQESEGWFLSQAAARALPLVATNECFFADTERFEAHDALLAIAAGRHINDEERFRVTPDHHFRSAADMVGLFADLPDALANTVHVARRCAFMPRGRKPILPPFPLPAGRSEADELRAQAEAGLADRLAIITASAPRTTYTDRLNYELEVIIKMGFAGYFLIVSDFIKWAKAQEIPVGPGRGSGAGSLVAYALLITDLDPLRFGLLFERFLNPERVSMPDFDIDFCQERRDAVIQYVQSRYGADRVAQIITFGKLQARAVVRDVGRVLGLPLGLVDRIAKLIPNNPAQPTKLAEAIAADGQLRQFRDEDPAIARLFAIALQLEGLYRNASTHAAGVVIAGQPLAELVPLYRDPRSPLPVTQYKYTTAEKAGLVKFDFLGLKTLDVIQHTVRLLAARGIAVAIDRLPLDDAPTYAMLARGETMGVFQLESSGMRDALRRIRPTRIEDIIALVALYRPGPMDNIPNYAAVKNGQEAADYLLPALEPVLRETYGVIIYQEQVMEIAQRLAGFTLGAADLLRRAMGKKLPEEMAALREQFVAGAVANGTAADRADFVFDLIEKFAGYGFNKSHAAAYAWISYQTAWLKANYPVDFLAASMTFDMGNTDKLALFRQELQRLQIPLLPPDINAARAEFAVEPQPARLAVRYALGAIKGVGLAAMQGLVAARDAAGPFADLDDFTRRLDPTMINKKMLEALIAAGALDRLQANRAALLAGAEGMLRLGASLADERNTGQVNLFGGGAPALRLPDTPPWDELTKLQHEQAAIGFYLSAHPLDSFRLLLERQGVVTASQLPDRREAGRVRLAGIVVTRRELTAKSGNRFAFVTLTDASGVFEMTVFSEVLSASREQLVAGTALLVTADLQRQGEELRLTATQIEPLAAAAARLTQGIRLRLMAAASLPGVAAALALAGRGRSRVTLALVLDEAREAELELPDGYVISPEIRSRLQAVPGVADVMEV